MGPNGLSRRQTVWRMVAACLLPAYLLSCTGWQRVQTPASETIASHPKGVRITVAGGRRIEVERPQILGDSLIGIETLSGQQLRDPEVVDKKPRVAVALAEISLIEVPRFDPLGTIVLAAAGVAGILGAVALVGSSPSSGGWSGFDSCCDFGGHSCPVVSSWDGTTWWRDSGTFAGAITAGLARRDVTVLSHAIVRDEVLRLRLGNELDEVDHTDQVTAIAVDHPLGTTVVPDEQGRLLLAGALVTPATARDFRGRDALARIIREDGWSWESTPTGRDSANPADLQDGLELTFPRPDSATVARLVVTGQSSPWTVVLLRELVRWHGTETSAWYDSLDQGLPGTRETAGLIGRAAGLEVAWYRNGAWQRVGRLAEAGPEVAKRQAVEIDLAGTSDRLIRVRLAGLPLAWQVDRIGLSYGPWPAPSVTPLRMVSGRSSQGRDVTALLAAVDQRYLTQERGAWAVLDFAAPAPPPGMVRSYAVSATGWYRLRAPATEPPFREALARLWSDSTAAARSAVGLMNATIATFNRP